MRLANRCASWQGRALRKRRARMAIFELDGEAPQLPADGRYWIADGAIVIGRVRLKTDASVWFNSVLRGDNEWIELGERSQIQDNAMLHTDHGFPLKIGDNCVIGHNVVLHGCVIAANSLIGMGAVVLNGARIGKNCLVGAGAVVTEGKEFPDNSLILGTPARAVRALDEKAAQAITQDADMYVRRWQQYAKGLRGRGGGPPPHRSGRRGFAARSQPATRGRPWAKGWAAGKPVWLEHSDTAVTGSPNPARAVSASWRWRVPDGNRRVRSKHWGPSPTAVSRSGTRCATKATPLRFGCRG